MERVDAQAIYLKQMELGPMQNFVYLVGDPETRECVVVDPAWEIDTIVGTAEADGMTITDALVTHTHQDHVGGSLESWGMPGRIPGLEELLGRVKAKVRVHKAEREFLKGLGSDLAPVDNHDTLKVGRLTLTFLHTPGHTPGSQCFLVDGRLISGDTLFIGSCGRTDLPGSDAVEMYVSRPQLRRPRLHDRRGEAPEPLHALRLARRFLTNDGRRAYPAPVARVTRPRHRPRRAPGP
ncbi:MAG: hypothetical protein AUH09_07545 [Candidatus Rokubacteria bacterium 13_2_20CM_70_12]|nr:MAG: hypothetical protein AUH09_07545 [Candidatus Rokubacteria bacterium 13_2_20CM_70_12]